MKFRYKYSIIILLLLPSVVFSQVRVWQEPMEIPTYLVGDPDPNPIFFHGRAYQGAAGKMYPYPLYDKLTDIRENQTYRAVYLENQYIRLCILPELGGRIFEAVDRTNGYDFFYRQHVIKPALIGMAGAWLSGGVEWNFPHHHRATSFLPVDYTTTENSDGSKTIWVGETEYRHRMKWVLGITLYPGKSIVEVTGRLINRTPFVHSFLYWANVAVHANEDYQVIFPPSVQFVTYHGKNQFSHWPVSTEIYNRVDYTSGVDVSWWKNHPSATSLFAWNCQEDFSAGYDHGKQAGVVHVADHHIMPGKKFWTWGTGTQGQRWETMLTETDGPYLELMVGAYSDNQPDYSWIQPYETKTFKQIWFPLRDLAGVKNANEKGAVNLEVKEDYILFGINTVRTCPNVTVVLKTDKKILFKTMKEIGPDKPYTKTIKRPSKIKENSLILSVETSDGTELISYRPIQIEKKSMPEPVKPPLPPAENPSVESLYNTGLRLVQFHHPSLDPYPYFEEALKRDPESTDVNTILGILYLKRGLFRKAEENLLTALKRLETNFTRPLDGEAYYYFGRVLRMQNRPNEAEDAFQRAAWSRAFHAAAYYELAELAGQKGEFQSALNYLHRSLSTNSLNARALNLMTSFLRKMGRIDRADRQCRKVLDSDPLDFWAGHEKYLLFLQMDENEKASRILEELEKNMRGEIQSYLELAVDYFHSGLPDEGIDVLSRYVRSVPKKKSVNPMIYYYLGYMTEKRGDYKKALDYYKEGSRMSPDYCFPYRLESIEVLKHVIKRNPKDARACYYLGNLLFDHQPEEAIRFWEKSRKLDGSYAVVHRNLGLAYARLQNEVDKAVKSLEKAVACNSGDPRYYYELDVLYEAAATPVEKRLVFLMDNHDIVKERDDALSREIQLLVQVGQYNRGIDLLKGHHFHIWEGGGRIHSVWVDAHLLRGKAALDDGRPDDALQDFHAANSYPENLEVGRPSRGGENAKVLYFIASAYEALGEQVEAESYNKRVVEQKYGWSPIRYYQGLAYMKLDQKDKAATIFDGLIANGQKSLESASSVDFFVKFGEKQSDRKRRANVYYLIGLGLLGKGRNNEAKNSFQKALELNPNHLWAAAELSDMAE
ncbi:DUF5107 domain-containing protein [bacterium]